MVNLPVYEISHSPYTTQGRFAVDEHGTGAALLICASDFCARLNPAHFEAQKPTVYPVRLPERGPARLW